MLEKAIPRFRWMRQLTSSSASGNRLIPSPGVSEFFSGYCSARASSNFSRFFCERVLTTTTTGIFSRRNTSGPLILGQVMSRRIGEAAVVAPTAVCSRHLPRISLPILLFAVRTHSPGEAPYYRPPSEFSRCSPLVAAISIGGTQD